MSSRGRGYPRSGRGGGYFRGTSNSYRGNSRSATGYSLSRGGSNRYNSGSYESRSSNSRYISSDERFPSNRSSDGYKRIPEYRGGSSRDRTPERKRSRYDQGSSRSHEYGSSSGDYTSSRNYESAYEHKRDSRNSRTPQSPQTPISRSTFRNRQSSTSGRRSQERMGPPKRIPPRSSRGVSYRGRLSSRGLRTSRVLIRRTDLRTIQRKRNIPSTKSREYLRSLKLARMRSSIKKKRSLERHSSEDRKERKRDSGDEDKEDRPAKDGEKKKSSASSKKKETSTETNEKDEQKSGDDLIEKTTATPLSRKTNAKTASVKKDMESASGNDDAKVKEEVSGDDSNNDAHSDDEKIEKKSKNGGTDFSPKNFYGKSFIKLNCVHCFAKCRTFKEYSQHLHERNHKMMMSKLYMKQKTKLSRMRQQQRNNQREIEEKGDNKSRPQFCPLCRLNYRQAKVKHQLSVGHRSMKKFLMPHCRICNITFKGPMIYEAHRCSLEHIKKKALAESRRQNQDSGDDEKVLDLNNFMTVDSVGDVDGNDDIDEANDDPNEKKEEINVGSEHVKKVEAYYCDLCRIHLPQQEEYQTSLQRHCSSNNHLRAYLQYREDKQLRKAAEKVHRKHLESKDNKEKDKTEVKISTEKAEVAPGDDSETDDVEEKMWASVDQDLGDLLREVGPENGNANNDDDEDEGSTAHAERYDRFKNSEISKNKCEEEIKAEIIEATVETAKEGKSEKSEVIESKE